MLNRKRFSHDMLSLYEPFPAIEIREELSILGSGKGQIIVDYGALLYLFDGYFWALLLLTIFSLSLILGRTLIEEDDSYGERCSQIPWMLFSPFVLSKFPRYALHVFFSLFDLPHCLWQDISLL